MPLKRFPFSAGLFKEQGQVTTVNLRLYIFDIKHLSYFSFPEESFFQVKIFLVEN